MSKLNKNLIKTIISTSALGALLLSANVVDANTRSQSVINAISACSKESNALKRLVCFDEIAKQLEVYEQTDGSAAAVPTVNLPTVSPNAPSAPIAPAAPPTSPAAAKDVPVASVSPSAGAVAVEDESEDENMAGFGLPSKPDKASFLIDGELHSQIVEVKRDKQRNLFFVLENGQVWEKTDNKKGGIPRVGDKVVLREGAFESFYLRKENVNRSFAVARVLD